VAVGCRPDPLHSRNPERLASHNVSTSIPDHFSLFGLEPRFGLDPEHLVRAYRTVQAHVHPDRYAAAGAAEQRAALQWATLANEAYQILNSPVRRAAYLCERHGVPVAGETARALASDFLVLQLEWRQELEEVRHDADPHRLDQLRSKATDHYQRALRDLEAKLDVDHDFAGAADGVRRLMFIEKFIKELEATGDATLASPAT
jgi:molecular chaperone HscB